jgi:hypothetical protein
MSSFSEISIQTNDQTRLIALSKSSSGHMLAVMMSNVIVFYDMNGNLIEGKSI